MPSSPWTSAKVSLLSPLPFTAAGAILRKHESDHGPPRLRPCRSPWTFQILYSGLQRPRQGLPQSARCSLSPRCPPPAGPWTHRHASAPGRCRSPCSGLSAQETLPPDSCQVCSLTPSRLRTRLALAWGSYPDPQVDASTRSPTCALDLPSLAQLFNFSRAFHLLT